MQNIEKTKRQVTLEDELFQIGIAALAAVLMLAVLYLCLLRKILPPIPCFFTTVLGIYCPGCGGTRALIAMLHGHFLKALWYHPLVPYMAVIYFGFMLTQGLNRLGFKRVRPWQFHNWYLWGGLTLLIVNFILKNVLRLGFGIIMH